VVRDPVKKYNRNAERPSKRGRCFFMRVDTLASPCAKIKAFDKLPGAV